MRLIDSTRAGVYYSVVAGLECGRYSSFRLTDGGQEYGKTHDRYDLGWAQADAFAEVEIEDHLCDSPDDAAGPPEKLSDDALEKGLQIIVTQIAKEPEHSKSAAKLLADVISGEADALAGDAFLQLVCFGEIVYG